MVAAVLDGQSLRLSRKLGKRGIPFVVYTALEHVDYAAGQYRVRFQSRADLSAAADGGRVPKPDLSHRAITGATARRLLLDVLGLLHRRD
jgi:hypothetical protein